MRAAKFAILRDSFRAWLVDHDHFGVDAGLGEAIIKSLMVTEPQKKILQRDLEKFLEYKVHRMTFAEQAEAIANGRGIKP